MGSNVSTSFGEWESDYSLKRRGMPKTWGDWKVLETWRAIFYRVHRYHNWVTPGRIAPKFLQLSTSLPWPSITVTLGWPAGNYKGLDFEHVVLICVVEITFYENPWSSDAPSGVRRLSLAPIGGAGVLYSGVRLAWFLGCVWSSKNRS